MHKPLDSRQLAAFAAVARRLSFTQAAKDLFLTQSAVSHALKALEDDVGARLIERSGRQPQLTPAGEKLLRRTEAIMREMSAARAELDESSEWGQTRLRVGASTTACQYILPTVLREFRESFPNCELVVQPGDHGRQVELLHSGQVDLALLLAPGAGRDTEFVPLFEDELCFLVHPRHAWVSAGEVDRENLGRETFVLYNRTSHTFQLVSDYFQRERVPLAHVIELGSMEAIKELVKIGLGVAVLAPWIAQAELASGALVALPLGKRKLTRTWGVAYARERTLSLAEQTFIGLCRSLTQDSDFAQRATGTG